MEICKTPPERLEEVMALYARAREFMRRTGNPDQWGQDYPGEELIARESPEAKAISAWTDRRSPPFFL